MFLVQPRAWYFCGGSRCNLGETSLGIGVYVSLFPFGFEGLTGDFYFIFF